MYKCYYYPLNKDSLQKLYSLDNFTDVILSCDSTADISKIRAENPDLYNFIRDHNILYSVAGGKHGRLAKAMKTGTKIFGDDGFYTDLWLRYFKRTLYSTKDIEQILAIYDEMDKNVNPNWSDIQKIMYYYTEIQKYLKTNKGDAIYYPSGNNDKWSLMCLLTGKFCCVGACSVLHDILLRLGMKSDVLTEDRVHTFNLFEFKDNKGKKQTLAADLSWDSVLKNDNNNQVSYECFGFNPKGMKHHNPTLKADKKKLDKLTILTKEEKDRIYNEITDPGFNKKNDDIM